VTTVKVRNRVKALRTKLKLSQRKLATKVGTSQQHLQRIETSDQNVRIDLAMRICKALGAPLSDVFPQSSRPIRAAVAKTKGDPNPVAVLRHLSFDPDTVERMAKAGVNIDPREYDLALRFRGRSEWVSVRIDSEQRSRLWRLLQDRKLHCVFQALDGYLYIVNTAQLIGWNFQLADPPGLRAGVDDEKKEPIDCMSTVRIWYADGTPVDETEAADDDPGPNADGEYAGPLEHIVGMLDGTESDEPGMLHFIDDGGDPYCFDPADVALMAIPEALIGMRDEEGRPVDPYADDDDDDDDDDDETSPTR
jgi:DNA-binding XRE family transcriptional regulator